MPTLAKVRAYAKGLINIRNQREIVTTVPLFAAENDQQYPPSEDPRLSTADRVTATCCE